ncbi:MAG: sensor histidine kinase [Gemmatimonadales bacterium]
MPQWPSSLRSRLTLWYTILLGLPLIAFAVACYFVFARTLEGRTDEFIGDALTAFSRELVAERRTALTSEQAIRSTVDEVRFRDLQIAVLDSAGHAVAATSLQGNDDPSNRGPASGAGDRVVAALEGHDLTTPFAVTLPGRPAAYRVLARPISVGAERFILTGTYSLGDIAEMLARIRGIFMVAIPLLLLAAATGGYFLAKRSLAPVAAMTARAADISATNLHERLPVGGGDELAGLASVVNDLLDRLEHSFAMQRRFVADASHELRTPTAILRTEADVTLSREHRREDEYRAAVTVMRDAARRLTRIVDDLFLLARADAGYLASHPETVDLGELVHDAARAVHSVADRRGVRVAMRELVEAPFVGDADLLGRLLLNLLDNAIKYSDEGGTVEVEMARHADRYEITVSDAGPGIPPEARDRVFERFFRVDTARSRAESSATSGAGLGLSIARRIAEMHAGRLELTESRAGLTVFLLTLPVSQ